MEVDTIDTVHRMGHRAFIGGNDRFWEEISGLQFDYVCAQGLQPADRFIDIACGALRGGHRFIRFLDPGHYFGIDKYVELLIYGVNAELGLDDYREKQPRFVVSDSFEFAKFDAQFTFGIAQSLFSHLTATNIRTCLTNLAAVAADSCRVFCTFLEVAAPTANLPQSHSNAGFYYTRGEMEAFGIESGWKPRYIGDWGHPRKQMLIEYVKG